MKAGVAKKKLKTYLAYLTRLRQAVAHPYLLENVLKENFTLEDLAYLRRQLASVGGKTPMHKQVQVWVTMEYEDRIAKGAGTTSFGKGRFGYDFDMDTQLEQMEAGKSMEDVICRLCYDAPVDPTITDVRASTNRPGWMEPANRLSVRAYFLPRVHCRDPEIQANLPDLQRHAVEGGTPQAV
jgi:hypothetical protein